MTNCGSRGINAPPTFAHYDRHAKRYYRIVDIVLPPGLKPVTITKVRIGQFNSDARPKHIRKWQPKVNPESVDQLKRPLRV